MLLELWIVAAVQCEIKTEYSEMIVSLPDEHQDALMGIIQDILDTVTPYEESQAVKSFPPATSHTMMASPPAPQSHTVPLSAASRDVIMELQATREELVSGRYHVLQCYGLQLRVLCYQTARTPVGAFGLLDVRDIFRFPRCCEHAPYSCLSSRCELAPAYVSHCCRRI